MEWMQNNWDGILTVIGGAVMVATAIVKITPTQKDDSILSKVIKVLAALSLVNPDGSVIGKKEDK